MKRWDFRDIQLMKILKFDSPVKYIKNAKGSY